VKIPSWVWYAALVILAVSIMKDPAGTGAWFQRTFSDISTFVSRL